MTTRRIRNYSAMTSVKLLAAYADLDDEYGDAYDRCITSGSGNPERDLGRVEELLKERGLLKETEA